MPSAISPSYHIELARNQPQNHFNAPKITRSSSSVHMFRLSSALWPHQHISPMLFHPTTHSSLSPSTIPAAILVRKSPHAKTRGSIKYVKPFISRTIARRDTFPLFARRELFVPACRHCCAGRYIIWELARIRKCGCKVTNEMLFTARANDK